MTLDLSEDFEGGSNGASITTGNTDFSSITGSTLTFDNAQVAHGGLSMKVVTSSSSAVCLRTFTARSITYTRLYFRMNALPAASYFLAQVSSSGTTRAQLRINTDGTVTIRNNLTAVYTTTVAMSAGQWYRLEWLVDNGSSSQEIRLYDGDNASALQVSGSQTYNQGTFDRVSCGSVTSSTFTGWIDDVVSQDTGWPGPAASAATGTASLALSATGDAAAEVTGAASLALTGAGTAAGPDTAAGTASLALSATGDAAAEVTGAASLALTGAGTAAAEAVGAATLTFSASGTTGDPEAAGTASLTLTASGAAGATAGGAAALALTASGAAAAEATGAASLTLSATGSQVAVHSVVFSAITPTSFRFDAVVTGGTSTRLAYAPAGLYPGDDLYPGDGVFPGYGLSNPDFTAVDGPDGSGNVGWTVTGLTAGVPYQVRVYDTPAGGSELPVGAVFDVTTALAASGTASLALSASGAAAAETAGSASLTLAATGAAGAPGQALGAASLDLVASGAAAAEATGAASLALSAGGAAGAPVTSGALLDLTASGAAGAGVVGQGQLTLAGSAVASAVAAGAAALALTGSATPAASAGGLALLSFLATGTVDDVARDVLLVAVLAEQDRISAVLAEQG